MRQYRKFTETLSALGALGALGGSTLQIRKERNSSSPAEIGIQPLPKSPKPSKLDQLVHGETQLSELEEEQAGIIQFDGGAPRAWAEALARLDPASPPSDISPKRWVQFIDDCGRFLDDGWAHHAERLGWGPLDLFGCDRTKPLASIDRAGLLWLLKGRKLLALTADAAAIATGNGGYLTCRPSIAKPGGVLAWELPHV